MAVFGVQVNEVGETAWSLAATMGAHLAGVSLTLLAAGLALHTLKLGTRARAWQNVLRASLPDTRVRFRDAVVPYLAGIGVGAVVPLCGGEVMRVAIARTRLRGADEKEGGGCTATIVGSLAVERALDVAVAVVVIVLALTAGLLPNGTLHGRLADVATAMTQPVVLGLAAGAILTAAAAAWRFRHRLAAVGAGVLQGLRVLRQPRRYAVSVASWQLLSWALRFGALVLLLEAFHVPSALLVAPVVLSLQILASSVPVTPAGAGTQQALVAAAFGSAAMVSFSAGAQAATLLLDVLLGLAALASCGIPLRLRAFRAAAVPT